MHCFSYQKPFFKHKLCKRFCIICASAYSTVRCEAVLALEESNVQYSLPTFGSIEEYIKTSHFFMKRPEAITQRNTKLSVEIGKTLNMLNAIRVLFSSFFYRMEKLTQKTLQAGYIESSIHHLSHILCLS